MIEPRALKIRWWKVWRCRLRGWWASRRIPGTWTGHRFDDQNYCEDCGEHA